MSQELRFTTLPAISARLKAQQAAQDFQRRVFSTDGPVDLARFASEAVRARFGRVSQPELDLLVAILLAETLRLLEEDSKEIEEALNALKRAGSQLQGAVRSAGLQATRSRPASTSRGTSSPHAPAPPGSRSTRTMKQTRHLGISYCTVPDGAGGSLSGHTGGADPGRVTIQGLKSVLDDMKGKLDGMNEMSEMTSLRLQMTMDRRSKFISTLSQIMKKVSTTQDTLVQNIK